MTVSVTDRCNIRCFYCMPAENVVFMQKSQLLSFEEIERFVRTVVPLGVRKIRITGGEPLVRRGIMGFFEGMGRHLESGALDELTLTTNGSQLEKYASQLAGHGVKRINVSIDTLDEQKFKDITRWGDLNKVLAGLKAAWAMV